MTVKQTPPGSGADQKHNALLANAGAVRTIAATVEGTLGPKGLDTMLVDRFGDVVITNDGMTILTRMDASHPAARLVINTARAQEEEVGDGTTTAVIVAAALLTEGVNQVMKGVPVARVIEGVRLGVEKAIEIVEDKAVALDGVDDPLLEKVALIAGRGDRDIARLVVSGAKLVGRDKLLEEGFQLKEIIIAKEGADNEVFSGTLIGKTRANKQMPEAVDNPLILVVDDSLEPEKVEDEALATEAGFQRFLALQEEFRDNLKKLASLGVKAVVVDKSISPFAEEYLTDAGIMAVARVPSLEIRKVCQHTGARAIRRTGLGKSEQELEKCLGRARRMCEDARLENIRVIGGCGKPTATILVGASTGEVREEKERICFDAASAAQAAIKGGVVPGGGAVEIACARAVENMRASQKGMQSYGISCVVEALKRPVSQIALNAGFNPLEKLGDVAARQTKEDNPGLAIDCDTGDVADMVEMGVVDPAPVKTYALKAALEIACAILRINTIIKKKDDAMEGAMV